MDWVIWFFTETIYGVLALATLAYGIAKLFRTSNAFLAAAIVFVLGLLTVPTYARYKFEKDTYAALAKHPEYKIVDTTDWGSVTEPLTWFRSFKAISVQWPATHIMTAALIERSRASCIAIRKSRASGDMRWTATLVLSRQL